MIKQQNHLPNKEFNLKKVCNCIWWFHHKLQYFINNKSQKIMCISLPHNLSYNAI